MTHLHEIPGIDENSLQLLEAVGIGSAEELAAQDIDHLVAELKRANAILSIHKRTPGKATAMKWIAGAMELVGEETDTEEDTPEEDAPEEDAPEEDAPEEADAAETTPEESDPEASQPPIGPPVNYEEITEVAEMLSHAPCAIPLPGKIMMERGLRVSDVPAGLLLNRYSGDLDLRVGDPTAPKTDMPLRRRAARVESVSKQATRRHFEASSAKLSTSPDGGKRVPASKSGHEDDRIALIRAPLEKTNRGKDPESRRYIRGVLHNSPWHLRCGAFFALLLLFNMPLAIISGFLLLASREYPGALHWVPEWILAFPIALPVTGLGYLIWGMSGKCRICTQKLFVHKGALKHIKAHRLRGMGYVVPLSLHLLAFHWFRCSSCGTPVRLKK